MKRLRSLRVQTAAPQRFPNLNRKRLLVVQTEFFRAGSLWIGRRCVKAAPLLRWMVGTNADQVKIALLKMGASWSWLPLRPRVSSLGLSVAVNGPQKPLLNDGSRADVGDKISRFYDRLIPPCKEPQRPCALGTLSEQRSLAAPVQNSGGCEKSKVALNPVHCENTPQRPAAIVLQQSAL